MVIGADNNSKHPHLYMTMSLQYLAAQLAILESFGFPREDALAVLEMTESCFLEPLGRTDAARVERLFCAAAEALSDPRVGIRAGYKFRVHDYAKTGSIYSHCNNMAQVFELNRRYQCLTVDTGLSEYRVENGRHYFLYNRYDDAKDMHQVLGNIFGAWATALRWLSWAAGHELKEAHLMPSAPDDITFYQEVVQCPIIFGQPRNHVELHAESINKPLITRNPEKLAQSIAMLDKVLNSGNETENFKASAIASIQAAMEEGTVNLPVVAARMNMPERRLRQKMSEFNLSFRDMVEDERKQLFRQLHAKGESFASISQALAYNDQPAFTRAFKRWYGVSPGAYAEAAKMGVVE